jgi:hypothetical protein
MRTVGRFLGTFALICAAALSAAHAQGPATAEASREYAIKAVFLYNFAHYVQWPAAEPVSEFTIGILGHDPFGAALDEIAATKQIDGRRIVIRRLASMADYAPCQILFLSSSASEELKREAIERVRGQPVLVVAEEAALFGHGVTINFFLEENKVRFEIDAEAARRGQLKISSRLLSLSKRAGG